MAFPLFAGLVWIISLIASLFSPSKNLPPSRPLDTVNPWGEPDHNPIQYENEDLTWYNCDQGAGNDHEIECTSILVPWDHFNPESSEEGTFEIPIARFRGHNATKNVLFNPGGPGGSGVAAVIHGGWSLHPLLGEGFHLVSWDPRGIMEAMAEASLEQSYASSEGEEEPTDPIVQFDLFFEHAKKGVEAEFKQADNKYVNTPQVAADMNSILDALNQKEMYFFGASYGALLGQTYATMYPERVERIIIDGIPNQFE